MSNLNSSLNSWDLELGYDLRKNNRAKIAKNLPGEFTAIEQELSIFNAIKYCKAWVIQRKWLKKNDVDFEKFEEEKEFLRLCKEFNLDKRARSVQISRSMKIVAQRLAEK